jgi:hypothetical protein
MHYVDVQHSLCLRERRRSVALFSQNAYTERTIAALVKGETPLPSSDKVGTHRHRDTQRGRRLYKPTLGKQAKIGKIQ